MASQNMWDGAGLVARVAVHVACDGGCVHTPLAEALRSVTGSRGEFFISARVWRNPNCKARRQCDSGFWLRRSSIALPRRRLPTHFPKPWHSLPFFVLLSLDKSKQRVLFGAFGLRRRAMGILKRGVSFGIPTRRRFLAGASLKAVRVPDIFQLQESGNLLLWAEHLITGRVERESTYHGSLKCCPSKLGEHDMQLGGHDVALISSG